MNHQIPMNKAVRRKGVTIAAATLSVALIAPFAQSVAYPEITAAAQAQEENEPAVEILSASKLPKNPPVFYANEETGNAVNRDTGNLTVRTTGILAGTFFPEGTKFRLKDNRFTFAKGANAQKEGGNEGQWNRTATIGWFGPSRSGIGQTNPEKLISPSLRDKATPFTPHPNNHPYVVKDTGQVLFALGPSAVKGERINVPMVAEWKDPKTGRTHQWEFFQGIQVGDPQVANRRQKPDNEKDWVFVGETPVESKRQSGNVKIGTRSNVVGQNFGWYGQKMGDIGEWVERKNVPKFRPTLADIAEDVEPQYKPVENGGTQSAQPSFVDQDDQSKTADKPTGSKFSLGEGAPPGATVNADTGVVSLPQPVGQDTTVPVKVTYSDGSSDTTNVVFKPAAKKTAEQVQPKYGKPKPGVKTSEKPTFHAEGNSDEIKEKPTGTFFGKGEGAPEGVTVDSETGVVSLDNPVTEETTVPVKVEYEDGSTDHVDVVFTPAKNSTPSISGLADKTVVEGQDIDPIKPVVANKGEGEITASGLPNGLSVDPETGVISGTPKISDWKDSFDKENPEKSEFEESRDFEVEVTVPGDPAAKQSFTVTVQRDTDGDGQPDVTDTDDDGDGVLDTDELKKGSNPKDKNSTPAPSISGDAFEGGNVIPEGEPTKIGQKVDNPTAGMGGTVTVDGKRVDDATVVVDPETGEITVTVPEGTLGDRDSEKPAKVQITDKDGNNVGEPIDAKVTKEISKVVDPEWKNTNLPDDGSRVNVPNTGDEIPHDTDVDLLVGYGEHNKGEQDWTVRLEEDGSITVIPGGDAAPEDSIEVHVELTYADGSTETKTFIVKVPLTFEGFFPENLGEPDYPNSEGSDRPNTPNTTHGEFGPITGEDSGDITAGDVFDQADRFDPEWNDTDTPEDGSAVTVKNTGDALPHGTTVELGWGHGTHNKGTQDWDVELEENGDITVTPGADAEHGDSVLVQAVITYADGSTETKEFIVQVPVSGEEYVPGHFGEFGPLDNSEETELTAEGAFGQAEMIEPNWADTSTPEDGSPVTVKNTGDALPHGTKVDLGWGHGTHNKGTQDWDVDLEENGDITVKPGADAKPGDSIVVEVSITYPDGTKETKSFVTQVPVTGEEFVPGNFGELPVLTGDDNDDLTAGDVFTEAPTVNPVNPGDNIITGTGKPGATITVTGPNGFSTTTTVNENGNWSIDLPGGATPEAQYIVSQKDGDKNESDQVLVTVGGDSEIVPVPGSSELPGSSLGSSNFDIPRHLQCAVFAGGVTAIPLILLSPLHNMYELVMNPHLAGLREQFNREIHAIDQQVRRSMGPEGRAALDVLDHINGRLHQFNQQLGQFAHENRHIGLAAAAIAVAGLSYQHCMNTQANQSSSATGSSVDLSSSSNEQAESRGIVGWFQGLFNRK
ncbi:Rib/alpha-like domain-containing protein [Corynebacterium pseudodiphtheriticum]|uniref:Rib/alpha-like domain-containing protein n=1 Tax=Corynebacterium pseudodiphtheriticum TaxID=37637 RepID=UPI003B636812